MFTVPRGPTWALIDAIETLVTAHPASIFGGSRSRGHRGESQDMLDHMPQHLRDDIGLPPVKAPPAEHPALTRAKNRASRWGS